MPVVENGIMFFHHDPSHRKLLDDGLLLVIDWKYAPNGFPGLRRGRGRLRAQGPGVAGSDGALR
jgi:hypothetical protein